MAVRRSIPVRLRWQPGRVDSSGLGYALLRWTDRDGMRKTRVLGYVDAKVAEGERGGQEAALRLGVSLPSSGDAPPTIGDLVEDYLLAIEREGRGTPTYRRHEMLHCVRIARHLGRVQADRIREGHLRTLVSACLAEQVVIPDDPQERKRRLRGARKKSSLLDMLGCLRRVYRAARDAGTVDCEPPPVPRGIVPDDARPPRRLTEAEVASLIRAGEAEVGAWFGRLLQFLAWCPRRPIAIFALTRADCARVLDPKLRRADVKINIRRDKAGKGRGFCPITEPALVILRAQLAAMADASPDALVWTSAWGRPLTSSLLAPQLARAAAEAGVEDVQVYDLRKFGASRVYEWAHGNLRVTADYTGHEDVATLLDRYVSAQQEEADALAGKIGWTPAPLRAVEDEEGG